jgi:uncharacterized membrane protein YhaH (DUF805 family)
MTPLQAIKTCLAKSFQFSGRSGRAEFWLFALAVFLVFHFFSIADFELRLRADTIYSSLRIRQINWLNEIDRYIGHLGWFLILPIGYSPADQSLSTLWMGDLTFLTLPFSSITAFPFLLLVVPSLSAMVRRSRDADFSGAVTLLAYFWPTIFVTANNFAHLITAPTQGAALARFTQNFFGPSFEYGLPLSRATALYAIYVLISPSSPGPNRYGPNPLEVTQ